MFKKIILLFLLAICGSNVWAQTANFQSSSLKICEGSYVHFRDQSSGGITGYYWDFGNGVTATNKKPKSAQYNTPGIYTVTLTVTGSTNSIKTVNVTVGGISGPLPTFEYDNPICMSVYKGTYGDILPKNVINTVPGGIFSSMLEPLNVLFFDPATGKVDNGPLLPPAPYYIYYTYFDAVNNCNVSSNKADLELNDVRRDADLDMTYHPILCNFVTLDANNFVGNIEWQSSLNNTDWTTGLGSLESYTTGPIFQTMYFRAMFSGPGCIDQYSETREYLVKGVSLGGVATVNVNEMCLNVQPVFTLTGFFGNVQWEQSPDGTSWSNASGWNSSLSFTPGNSTITGFSPDPVSSASLVYYRAKVRYNQTGTDCADDYSNVIQIDYKLCTVTSVINNANTSPICVGLSGVGLNFTESSFATPSSPGLSSVTGWDWDFSAGSTITPYSTSQNPGLIVFDKPGIHKIYLEVFGPGGLRNESFTTVTINGLSKFDSYDPSINTFCGFTTPTISLNNTNINNAPVYQWQFSSDGTIYNDVTGEIGSGITLSPVTASGFYRSIIKNGVCNAITAPGYGYILAPITTITGLSPDLQTICYGNDYVLSADGVNGNVSWEYSTTSSITGFGNNVSGEVINTGYLFETRYYRANISDVAGCETKYAPVNTIKVEVCPILASISGIQRICYSNPTFNLLDATPTINGVTFTKWEWDFGPNATPPQFTTTPLVFLGSRH